MIEKDWFILVLSDTFIYRFISFYLCIYIMQRMKQDAIFVEVQIKLE